MNITVVRKVFTPESTQGEMFLDGVFEAYTLEPPADQAPTKPRAVSIGTYTWAKGMSEHFGFEVVKVADIPDFDNVEIHPGNFPSDTHGCCLVGANDGANFIGHSREAFDALMAKLPDSGTITYQ